MTTFEERKATRQAATKLAARKRILSLLPRNKLEDLSGIRYMAWAEANPEEARKATKWTDPVTGRVYPLGRPRRSSAGSSRERNKDWGAYEAGRKAGERVSIDPQTEGGGKRAAIAGPKAMHL